MVLGETKVFLDSSHVRVTYETDQRQKGLKRSRQERPKQPKTTVSFEKETVVLTHFFHGYERDSMCSVFLTCQGTLEPDETNQRQ